VEAAKEVVEQFCRAEYKGIEGLCFDFVEFSPQREKRERKRDPLLKGWVIYVENDPLYIVASYQILEVSVKNNRAAATVAYTRLARTQGDGHLKRQLIPASPLSGGQRGKHLSG
ncbi:MAG: hypothetical protein HY731_09245, partial [Candidatus Tectomicrobia bacterium]|nr:hypothetical protein [Candidatus Tectomicrobia bacterium]